MADYLDDNHFKTDENWFLISFINAELWKNLYK